MQHIEAGNRAAALPPHGLAGWLLARVHALRPGPAATRTLALVEQLPLGGRRSLSLIRCGDELFLVGGSTDTIATIVKVSAPSIPAGARP